MSRRFFLAICTLLFPTFALAQLGPGPFAAFPTANETDARMLSFGCEGIDTLELRARFTLAVPAGDDQFTLSFFDGDTGKEDASGADHWDSGDRQLVYSLYYDPLKQGNTDPADLVGQWLGNEENALAGPEWTASAAFMPDNDWWGVTVEVSDGAQAPSGSHFYHLEVRRDGECVVGEVLASDFKVAGTANMNFSLPRFGVEGSLRSPANTGPIVYETFDPLTILDQPTTYDGTFTFFLDVPESTTELSVFDGDFDFGTNPTFLAGVPSGFPLVECSDEDDANTPADYGDFPFDPQVADPEGAQPFGEPADDSGGDVLRRGELGSPGRIGCVRYELIDPEGNVYRNDNPSSNLEWERFSVVSRLHPDAFTDGADYTASSDLLPAGVWTLRTVGLDLMNLTFWFLENDACAEREGEPACPAGVYLIGDTVWRDENGNGIQDPGESGIRDVVVELFREGEPYPIATTTTGAVGEPGFEACRALNTGLDENGLYCFEIDQPGTYTVRIAPISFFPDRPLEGLSSTTGGETQTRAVVDDNVLAYDFGYRASGSGGEGCTPGYWKQRHHFDSWQGYGPWQSYERVFDVNAAGKLSLLDALRRGGGGFKALGRHAVAALLNAANDDVDYGLTVDEVIALVREAYADGEPEAAKDQLEELNESGCPLN